MKESHFSRSSKRSSQHAVPKSNHLSRECRSKMKLGTGHDDILCSHNVGSNQGKIKFIFKSNDKKYKAIKLIFMPACKDSTPKFTAMHCKKAPLKELN